MPANNSAIKRILHTLLIISFTATNHFGGNALALPPGRETSNPSASHPFSISEVRVPSEIGEIQEIYRGNSSEAVVLIQDAHAIPDAQKNIQRLIKHFQKEYGAGLVALEGAASRLDSQFLKSFPDKESLNKVFEQYRERGELAGGVAAAVFPAEEGKDTVFQGIEDWKLYEEGLVLYQQAMGKEPELLNKMEDARRRLQAEKEKIYSKELLKVDRALEAFSRNEMDLITVLKILNRIEKGTGSEVLPIPLSIRTLLEEIAREAKDSSTVDREVTAIAERVKASLGTGSDAGSREFNKKYQAFRTSRISAAEFALDLKELAEKGTGRGVLPAPFVSDRLNRIISRHKHLRDIQGTQFFKDFETYAKDVKESLFRNDIERTLNSQTRQLELFEKLARLELSCKDWEAVKMMNGEKGTASDLLPFPFSLLTAHFSFYETAEKRDKAFFINLKKLMKEEGRQTALVVSGGFHTEGLTEQLKQQGISYIILTPHMESVPEQSNYRAHMRGNVSWKDYFEAENGRVNLYKAFVRATRDKLLNASKMPQGELLKSWRDQIIRDLAAKEEMTKVQKYTQFIDEIGQKRFEDSYRNRWFANIDRFIDSLGQLDIKGRLNEPNVLKLLKPSTTIPAATGTDVLDEAAWIAAPVLGNVKGWDGAAVRSAIQKESVLYDVLKPIASRSEVRVTIEIPGPDAENPIFLELPESVAADIQPITTWNPTYEEADRKLQELFSMLEQIKQNPEDDVDLNTQFYSSAAENSWLFLWFLEHLSEPLFPLTDEQRTTLRNYILKYLDVDLLVNIGSLDMVDPDRVDESLKFYWFILIRLLVLDEKLRTKEKQDSPVQEHQGLIQDSYRLLLSHINSILVDIPHFKNAFYETLLIDLARQQPKLKTVIMRLLQNWEDWTDDGRTLGWELLNLDKDGIEAGRSSEAIVETFQEQKILFNELKKLQNAVTPESEETRRAWDFPLDYLKDLAKNKNNVFFSSYVLLEDEGSKNELPNSWNFQLSSIREMGTLGFRNWAIANSRDYLYPIESWLRQLKQERPLEELVKDVQDYFNQKKGKGLTSLRTFLSLPEKEPVSVTQALKFWETLWDLKESFHSEVMLFNLGFFEGTSKEKNHFTDWWNRVKNQKRFVLGFENKMFVLLDDVSQKTVLREALWIMQKSADEDYQDEKFEPKRAFPYVAHLIGENRSWGDHQTVAIPLRNNQAVLDIFNGELAAYQSRFLEDFNIVDRGLVFLGLHSRGESPREYEKTLFHALIVSKDTDEEEQAEPLEPEEVDEKSPQSILRGSRRAEVRAESDKGDMNRRDFLKKLGQMSSALTGISGSIEDILARKSPGVDPKVIQEFKLLIEYSASPHGELKKITDGIERLKDRIHLGLIKTLGLGGMSFPDAFPEVNRYATESIPRLQSMAQELQTKLQTLATQDPKLREAVASQIVETLVQRVEKERGILLTSPSWDSWSDDVMKETDIMPRLGIDRETDRDSSKMWGEEGSMSEWAIRYMEEYETTKKQMVSKLSQIQPLLIKFRALDKESQRAIIDIALRQKVAHVHQSVTSAAEFLKKLRSQILSMEARLAKLRPLKEWKNRRPVRHRHRIKKIDKSAESVAKEINQHLLDNKLFPFNFNGKFVALYPFGTVNSPKIIHDDFMEVEKAAQKEQLQTPSIHLKLERWTVPKGQDVVAFARKLIWDEVSRGFKRHLAIALGPVSRDHPGLSHLRALAENLSKDQQTKISLIYTPLEDLFPLPVKPVFYYPAFEAWADNLSSRLISLSFDDLALPDEEGVPQGQGDRVAGAEKGDKDTTRSEVPPARSELRTVPALKPIASRSEVRNSDDTGISIDRIVQAFKNEVARDLILIGAELDNIVAPQGFYSQSEYAAMQEKFSQSIVDGRFSFESLFLLKDSGYIRPNTFNFYLGEIIAREFESSFAHQNWADVRSRINLHFREDENGVYFLVMLTRLMQKLKIGEKAIHDLLNEFWLRIPLQTIKDKAMVEIAQRWLSVAQEMGNPREDELYQAAIEFLNPPTIAFLNSSENKLEKKLFDILVSQLGQLEGPGMNKIVLSRLEQVPTPVEPDENYDTSAIDAPVAIAISDRMSEVENPEKLLEVFLEDIESEHLAGNLDEITYYLLVANIISLAAEDGYSGVLLKLADKDDKMRRLILFYINIDYKAMEMFDSNKSLFKAIDNIAEAADIYGNSNFRHVLQKIRSYYNEDTPGFGFRTIVDSLIDDLRRPRSEVRSIEAVSSQIQTVQNELRHLFEETLVPQFAQSFAERLPSAEPALWVDSEWRLREQTAEELQRIAAAGIGDAGVFADGILDPDQHYFSWRVGQLFVSLGRIYYHLRESNLDFTGLDSQAQIRLREQARALRRYIELLFEAGFSRSPQEDISLIQTLHLRIPTRDLILQEGGEDIVAVTSLAFSPDGQRLAWGDSNGRIVQRNLQTNETDTFQVEEEDDPAGRISTLAYSSDGQNIAWGRWYGIAQRNLPTGDTEMLNDVIEDLIRAFAFSSDGQRIVVGSDNGTIAQMNLQTNETEIFQQGQEPGEGIHALAYFPDSQRLAWGDLNGRVVRRNLQTGETEILAEAEGNYFTSLAFSPDGQKLALANNRDQIFLRNLQTGDTEILQEGGAFIETLAFSTDSQRLAWGDSQGTVRVRELLPPVRSEVRSKNYINKVVNTALTPHPEWIMGGNPQAILRQEQEGQLQLSQSQVLPMRGTEGKEDEWKALGIELGPPVENDPLFRYATFPEGWKIVPRQHHMWSDLADANGEARARIFYKAAFYDRRASVDIEPSRSEVRSQSPDAVLVSSDFKSAVDKLIRNKAVNELVDMLEKDLPNEKISQDKFKKRNQARAIYMLLTLDSLINLHDVISQGPSAFDLAYVTFGPVYQKALGILGKDSVESTYLAAYVPPHMIDMNKVPAEFRRLKNLRVQVLDILFRMDNQLSSYYQENYQMQFRWKNQQGQFKSEKDIFDYAQPILKRLQRWQEEGEARKGFGYNEIAVLGAISGLNTLLGTPRSEVRSFSSDEKAAIAHGLDMGLKLLIEKSSRRSEGQSILKSIDDLVNRIKDDKASDAEIYSKATAIVYRTRRWAARWKVALQGNAIPPGDMGHPLLFWGLERLKSKHAQTRVMAAIGLGYLGPEIMTLESGDQKVVSQLMRALEDKSLDVQHATILALGMIGPAAQDAVPVLQTIARKYPEETPRTESEAILNQALNYSLFRIEPPSNDPLSNFVLELSRRRLQELHSPVEEDRERAIAWLNDSFPRNSFSERYIDQMLSLLNDPEARIRRGARLVIAELGAPAVEAVPALIESFTTQPAMRFFTTGALGWIGSGAAEAVPSLIRNLHLVSNFDPVIRTYRAAMAGEAIEDAPVTAARALGRIGPAAEEAVPHLINALRRRDSVLRNSAATALGQIGVSNKKVINALTRISQSDDSEQVRQSAKRALNELQAVSRSEVRNQFFESFLDQVDVMPEKEQFYELFLRAVWGKFQGANREQQVAEFAKKVQISEETQNMLKAWASDKVYQLASPEDAFEQAFWKVFEYFSSKLDLSEIEERISDRSTGIFKPTGKEIGGLFPDDARIDQTLIQLILQPLQMGYTELHIAYDEASDTPQIEVAFSDLEAEDEEVTEVALPRFLDYASRISYDSLVLRLKKFASLNQVDPEHFQTLEGSFAMEAFDKPVEIHVVVTGQGENPEEVDLTFSFPEGRPEYFETPGAQKQALEFNPDKRKNVNMLLLGENENYTRLTAYMEEIGYDAERILVIPLESLAGIQLNPKIDRIHLLIRTPEINLAELSLPSQLEKILDEQKKAGHPSLHLDTLPELEDEEMLSTIIAGLEQALAQTYPDQFARSEVRTRGNEKLETKSEELKNPKIDEFRAIRFAALALAPDAGRVILARIDSDTLQQIVDKYRRNKEKLRAELKAQVDSVKYTAQLAVINNLDARMSELQDPSVAIAAVIPEELQGDSEASRYFLEGYFEGIDRSVGEMLIDGRIPDAYHKEMAQQGIASRSDLNIARPIVLKTSEQNSVPVAMFAENNPKIHSMFTPVFVKDMPRLVEKLAKDPDAPQKLRWLGKLTSRTEIHLADLSQVARLKKDPNALKAELLRRLDLEGYDLITISQNGGRSELRINAIQAVLAFSDLVRRTIQAAA